MVTLLIPSLSFRGVVFSAAATARTTASALKFHSLSLSLFLFPQPNSCDSTTVLIYCSALTTVMENSLVLFCSSERSLSTSSYVYFNHKTIISRKRTKKSSLSHTRESAFSVIPCLPCLIYTRTNRETYMWVYIYI